MQTVTTVKLQTQYQRGVKPKKCESSAATDGSLLLVSQIFSLKPAHFRLIYYNAKWENPIFPIISHLKFKNKPLRAS